MSSHLWRAAYSQRYASVRAQDCGRLLHNHYVFHNARPQHLLQLLLLNIRFIISGPNQNKQTEGWVGIGKLRFGRQPEVRRRQTTTTATRRVRNRTVDKTYRLLSAVDFKITLPVNNGCARCWSWRNDSSQWHLGYAKLPCAKVTSFTTI